MSGFGPTVLRLVVGIVFLSHGAMKLWPELGGLAETTELFESLGFRWPGLVAAVLGAVELGGGATLVLGAHTGWTASALILTTLVTGWRVHLPHGGFLGGALGADAAHGAEFDLVLVGALLCLLATGAGHLSFDGVRRRAADRAAAGLARLRRG